MFFVQKGLVKAAVTDFIVLVHGLWCEHKGLFVL